MNTFYYTTHTQHEKLYHGCAKYAANACLSVCLSGCHTLNCIETAKCVVKRVKLCDVKNLF